MSEIKHTDGPWRVARYSEGIEDGMVVCMLEEGGEIVVRSAKWTGLGDKEADARLIAAAPDLLEALAKMVKRIEYYSSLKDDERPNIEQWEYTEGSTDMAKARAAIAKALGE